MAAPADVRRQRRGDVDEADERGGERRERAARDSTQRAMAECGLATIGTSAGVCFGRRCRQHGVRMGIACGYGRVAPVSCRSARSRDSTGLPARPPRLRSRRASALSASGAPARTARRSRRSRAHRRPAGAAAGTATSTSASSGSTAITSNTARSPWASASSPSSGAPTPPRPIDSPIVTPAATPEPSRQVLLAHHDRDRERGDRRRAGERREHDRRAPGRTAGSRRSAAAARASSRSARVRRPNRSASGPPISVPTAPPSSIAVSAALPSALLGEHVRRSTAG